MTRLNHSWAVVTFVLALAEFVGAPSAEAAMHYGVGELVASPGTPAFLSIDGATGSVTLINPDIGFSISAIAQNPFTGILYAVGPRLQGETFYTMDPGTGALTQVNPDIGPPVRSMEFDPTTGTLYAAVGGPAERFGTINPGTGAFTEISPDVGREMAGLGFDAAGNLYSAGAALAGEQFYSINKADGVRTVINADIGPPLQSLSFDSNLGTLVGTFGGSSNQWRSLTTGGTLSLTISTLGHSVIALTAVIPEPSTGVLMALAGLTLALTRRTSSRPRS